MKPAGIANLHADDMNGLEDSLFDMLNDDGTSEVIFDKDCEGSATTCTAAITVKDENSSLKTPVVTPSPSETTASSSLSSTESRNVTGEEEKPDFYRKGGQSHKKGSPAPSKRHSQRKSCTKEADISLFLRDALKLSTKSRSASSKKAKQREHSRMSKLEKIHDLSIENKYMRAQNRKLRSQVGEYRNKAELLESELHTSKTELAKDQNAKDDGKEDAIRALTAAAFKQKNSLEENKEKLVNLREELHEAKEQCRVLDKEKSKFAMEAVRLRNEVAELQIKLHKSEKENMDKPTEYEKVEKECRDLKKKNLVLTQQLTDALNKIGMLQKKSGFTSWKAKGF